MNPTPIILDCDPGHDDALAMILAAYNPTIELLGITTVSGNGIIAKVTENALRICSLANIKVPVAQDAQFSVRLKLRLKYMEKPHLTERRYLPPALNLKKKVESNSSLDLSETIQPKLPSWPLDP